MENPLGTLDVHPEAKLDFRLASIPVYPGAMPENALAAESVSELRIGWKTVQEISATYWTPDSANKFGISTGSICPTGRGIWFSLRARS